VELSEAIRGRRATRQFAQTPVAKPALLELIDAAIQAPSAINAQPWEFTVIQNRTHLDRIAASSKAYMLTAMEHSAAPQHLRDLLKNPDFDIFYHAPALIVISAKSGDWAVEDAALAAQNLMLAAYAKGLGTCWIGFAQRWLETDEGKRSIELPPGIQPVAPIIVGYPAGPMPPVPRNQPRVRWFD
jgi:nitroreductase